MLTYDGDVIVYRERLLPLALRLFIIFLGLGVGIGIPTPFIMHADWANPSPVLIIVVACIVFPVLLGAFFLLIALVSATELRLDPTTRRAWRKLRGPIVNKQDSFAFADIELAEVRMKDSEDGPFPILRLILPGWRRWLDMACFDSRTDAEAWRKRIMSMLAGQGAAD